MKKYISIVAVLLLLVSGVFIYKYFKAQISTNDIIIKVDKGTFIKTSEEKVLSFYEKNKEDFKALADYVLANEMLLGTRPVVLNKDSSALIEKITDESIKKIVDEFLQEGTIKGVSSLNDDIKDVNFYVDNEYGIYAQGIRYVSDTQIIDSDKTKYNYVKEYKELGNGWFYYLYYYNEIKDADIYRKILWDQMVEMDKNSIKYDWHKAIVTLEDWDSVGFKMDNVKRKFVVSVCFHTELDGLLGPIIAYFDPSTKKIVGAEYRR